jgi:soluble lytic murein transglycosylase
MPNPSAPSPRHRPLTALFAACALLGAGAAAPAFAQSASDASLKAAIDAAEAGRFDAARFNGVAAHPAYGWVEYAALRRNMDVMLPAQAQAFLSRYQGQAVADTFRNDWLASRSRMKDWTGFRAAWAPTVASTTLRCAELNARLATGATDAQWVADAQKLWRSTGKSLPNECDAPFAALSARGGLTPALRWERLEKAAAEWQPGVMRTAANGLPADEAALANDYAAFVQAPHARALNWPKTPRSRLVASYGLAKLGKSSPGAAEAQLPQYAQALGFTEEDRGRVLYQIALWTVASYLPESARRLAAVPAASYDASLHEFRVREALARRDWRTALDAIKRMPADMRDDSRWTWFEARTTELTGNGAAAQALYRRAATQPDFHGFLAADKLNLPYTLCPLPLDTSAKAKAAVAKDPALVRAIALQRAGRKSWAGKEWDDAITRYSDTQRRVAVAVAQDAGWFDRGVFGLWNADGKRHDDELRLYTLRFPIHHADVIEREAQRNRIDPAWVAAEIRAESLFDPRARSSANAMGLMQVLPGTGASVAKRVGQPWGGADSLYDPETNIILGTAYLRQLSDKYGKPYEVMAGYNAGPAPLNRWKSQRPGMDPDFWIETISYKETREYVARILAFSVLYDWRMHGDAQRVTDRMNGLTGGARKQFACPAGS